MRPDEIAFPAHRLEPGAGRAPIVVRWLGTAGFSVEHAGTTILIDPYVTRAPLLTCLGRLRSDEDAIARYAPRADAIVVGHTHFDHALDVPGIARRTGALVYGSRSAAALCRAAGIADSKIVDVESAGAPSEAEVGPFRLRFVPSCHSRFLLGRVPFPGDISDCDHVPVKTADYKCGAVFSVELKVANRTIYHLGSADLVDERARGPVDLLLLCVAGWTTTEKFAPRVLRALSPVAVLLSHWDNFFSPMDKGARPLPAMKMERLVDALTVQDRALPIGTIPILGELNL